jgi:MFS family permease
LVGKLSRQFGEARLIIGGTLLSCLALGCLPYAPGAGPLLAILAVLALGQGVAHPSLSALTSKLATADEMGGVMGVFQGMASLARIAGPFWAEVAYGRLGFAWPFRTGSVFMAVACGMAVVALARSSRKARVPG